MLTGSRGLAFLFAALAVCHCVAQPSGSVKPVQPGRSVAETARKNPDNLQLVTAAGEYYFHHGHWKESTEWLSRAFKLSGNDPTIGYDLAYARIQAGDLDTAQEQLEQMSAKDDTARLHSLLGELEERRGKASGAVHEYYRAAQIEPSESNIFDLANSLLQHKQYAGYLPESVKYFRFGVSKYPQSSKLLVGLGVALYASQEYDEAVKVLCAAVDLDPSDPRPVTFLGMARRVSPDLAGQVNERLRAFAKQYPENAAASYEYAMSLWDGGGKQGQNIPDIERLLQRAVRLEPRWYEPHYQLGLVYGTAQRYTDAIREMRRAAELEPDFKPAHFQLAMLYKRVGDNAHAAEESARAKRLDNNQIKSELLQGGFK